MADLILAWFLQRRQPRLLYHKDRYGGSQLSTYFRTMDIPTKCMHYKENKIFNHRADEQSA
jgi:hypothetical protein